MSKINNDVLIVCHNEAHARKVKEAFGIEAMYCTYCSAILGHRFDKIIVFSPPIGFASASELSAYKEVLDYLPTKLSFDHRDKFFVV